MSLPTRGAIKEVVLVNQHSTEIIGKTGVRSRTSCFICDFLKTKPTRGSKLRIIAITWGNSLRKEYSLVLCDDCNNKDFLSEMKILYNIKYCL